MEQPNDNNKEPCCRDSLNLLCDYLEGDLDQKIKQALDHHMEACAPCLAFLNTYRKTTEICKSLSSGEIPAELKARLKEFLKCSGLKSD